MISHATQTAPTTPPTDCPAFGSNGITMAYCRDYQCSISGKGVVDAQTGYCRRHHDNPPAPLPQPVSTHVPLTAYERAMESARRARAAGHMIAAAHHERRAIMIGAGL